MSFEDGWRVIGFILALSLASAALLQLFDDILPIRLFYQKRWLTDWVRNQAEVAATSKQASQYPFLSNNFEKALMELVVNATSGYPSAFFGLPPGQLVAQMNAAAQIALEHPHSFQALLVVLSQPRQPPLRMFGRSELSAPINGQDAHLKDLATVMKPPLPSDPPDVQQKYLECRNRVVHRIQRNLDGIQISLQNETVIASQGLAILISVLLALVAREYSSGPWFGQLLSSLLLAVTAGALSPTMANLLAGIRTRQAR